MDVQAAVDGGAQVGAALGRLCSLPAEDDAALPARIPHLPRFLSLSPTRARSPPTPVQAVGVCTGIYTRQELVEAAPEAVVLDDLADLSCVLTTFGLQ
jgi:hypothetical protein